MTPVNVEHWRIGRRDGRFLQVIQISLAKKILRQDQAAGRFPVARTDYKTVVDHKPLSPEESVRFGGRISYVNKSESDSKEMLIYARDILFKLSPIGMKRPGVDIGWRAKHYSDNHEFLVNARGPYDLNNIGVAGEFPDNSVIDIRTTLVYARRIEKGWSLQRPTGVMRIAAILLRRRFSASWTFNYHLARYNDLTDHKIWRMEGHRRWGPKKKVIYDQLYPTISCMPKSRTARLVRGQRQTIQ